MIDRINEMIDNYMRGRNSILYMNELTQTCLGNLYNDILSDLEELKKLAEGEK